MTPTAPSAGRNAVCTAADTPFGEILARWVLATAGAVGAVLCDDRGEPIDYAHVPGGIAPLDLQIHGAQTTRAVEMLGRWCARHGLRGDVVVLVECAAGSLVLSQPAPGFFATGVLEAVANLGSALRAWEGAHAGLQRLLR